MREQCNISVIIPTRNRPLQLKTAIDRIVSCDPAPAEVIVHVDGSDEVTVLMLEKYFQNQKIRWIKSDEVCGPGLARNLLVGEARTPFFASFDDDSWPIEIDFFARVANLLGVNENVGVVACMIDAPGYRAFRGENDGLCSSFQGCGCVFRKDAFVQTRGYLPIVCPYGIEEADLALQLLDLGWDILKDSSLLVFHDCDTTKYSDPLVNSAQIENTALLAFLRYPSVWWLLGVLQVMNRVLFSVRSGRFRGIWRGIWNIPQRCWKFRKFRSPVRIRTVLRSRALRF